MELIYQFVLVTSMAEHYGTAAVTISIFEMQFRII